LDMKIKMAQQLRLSRHRETPQHQQSR
jgi:hypothetical protein